MKKLLPVLILVVVVAGAGYWLYTKNTAPSQTLETAPVSPQTTGETTTPAVPTGESMTKQEAGTTKEIAVSGSEFAFTPKTFTVSKGQTVKLTFTNDGNYPHNFTIKELNVHTSTVQPGKSDTVTFTADTAGSFEYYCSVDAHADKGMIGTLVVQ